MKKLFASWLIVSVLVITRVWGYTPPDEGMWLPMFVERLDWAKIQQMGLRLTPEELYSINRSSLKDAIVGLASGSAPGSFFCTGEIVSEKGLVFTNHHCAYDIIQKHSTVENDYLTNGFWAKNLSEELPNPGLTASILIRMEDVTDTILSRLDDTMTPEERRRKVREITNSIRDRASENGKFDAVVKSFFHGNEYYLFVYETYRDVRLVGAPPSSIGKFGGDTDNWMWPRHTGDFAVLRIYTAPDGSPAEYSEENIPLKPRHFLPISLRGYELNDFAMIWGFPGSTERYLTSYGVDYAINQRNPAIIDVLGVILESMKKQMDSDDALRIRYASEYASLANAWKYYIGQTRGLKRLDVKSRKENLEMEFINWYLQDPQLNEKYGNVLNNLRSNYSSMQNLIKPYLYFAIGSNNISWVSLANQTLMLESLLENRKQNKNQIMLTVDMLEITAREIFSDFNRAMEKDLLISLLRLFRDRLPSEQLPDIFKTIDQNYRGNIEKFVEEVFSRSIFTDEKKYQSFLHKPSRKTLQNDPGAKLARSLSEELGKYQGNFQQGQLQIDHHMRLFIAGLREMKPEMKFYPDANSTLRFTYGTVKDYYPADAVHYHYITRSVGILEKEDPDNEEFIVDSRLKDLILRKDFGRYGHNGELIINFLTTTDITGGNSGSPVINSRGELIGIAFDGNWEAMSGDIAFEPELQRTISVDIRYVLFVIDKFAEATHLIDELHIVP